MTKKEFSDISNDLRQYLPNVDFVYDKRTKTAKVQISNMRLSNVSIPVEVLFDIMSDCKQERAYDWLEPY